MKKIALTILLSIVMTVSLFSGAVFAEELPEQPEVQTEELETEVAEQKHLILQNTSLRIPITSRSAQQKLRSQVMERV